MPLIGRMAERRSARLKASQDELRRIVGFSAREFLTRVLAPKKANSWLVIQDGQSVQGNRLSVYFA
jgi:hypothetical protein